MKPSDFHPELPEDKRFVTAANVKQAVTSWLQMLENDFINPGHMPWYHGGTRN